MWSPELTSESTSTDRSFVCRWTSRNRTAARDFLKDQREPATRPWECSWSRSTAAIWSATLEPSSHRPLTLSLPLSRLAAWNLRKPEIHFSILSLKNLPWAEIKIQDQYLLPVVVVVYATIFHFGKKSLLTSCYTYLYSLYLDRTHFEAAFLDISFSNPLILLIFQVLLQSIFFRQ